MQQTITYQEPKALKAEFTELAEIIPMLCESITDNETFVIASNEKLKWDDVEVRWIAYWEEAKSAAHKVHKIITKMEREGLDIVKANREPLKKAISDYLLEQRAKEEAERNRVELEHIARAEEERKALKEASDKALEAGKIDVAKALEEQASLVYVEPVMVEPIAPKKIELEGGGSQSAKEDWDVAITDERVFARAALSGEQRIPWSAVTVSINLPALKAWIRSERIKSFPGLSIIPKMSITTRRK